MRIYLSHAIRGTAGSEATPEEMAKNCEEAIIVANTLRRQFPKLQLYVPAENETFIQIAFDTGHLSEKQILDVDCHIIDTLDAVLVYVPDGDILQGGRLVEYNHAANTHKKVIIFHKEEEAIDWLTATYRGLLI